MRGRVSGWVADVVTAPDEGERPIACGRHARDRAHLDTVHDQRVSGDDAGFDLDDAQRQRGIGTATVHALDQFLPGVTPLREADRNGHHPGHGRDGLAGNDLEAEPRPTGRDACRLVFVRRRVVGRGLDVDLRLHPDLEPIEPGGQRFSVSGVDVEVEAVLARAGHASERFDLAGRFQYQRPRTVADGEVAEVLRHLRVEIRECIGPFDDHVIAGGIVDGGGIGSHTISLPWHTAIGMTYDDTSDNTRDGRLHDLATRAVDSLLTLVHRGTRLAFGTMIIVIVVCVGCFALGIAALSDGIETVWILFGGFAAFVAIGAVVVAMFRLWVITRLGAALISDVERLIAGDPRSERVVIETIEASDGVQDQSAVVMSRQFFTMSDTVGTAGQFTALAVALRSVTTFPLLILLATVITIGMAGLSLLFLLGILL